MSMIKGKLESPRELPQPKIKVDGSTELLTEAYGEEMNDSTYECVCHETGARNCPVHNEMMTPTDEAEIEGLAKAWECAHPEFTSEDAKLDVILAMNREAGFKAGYRAAFEKLSARIESLEQQASSHLGNVIRDTAFETVAKETDILMAENEKLSAELIGYKEALDRCQDVQRDLFNKLTQAKAELEEKTKALEGIETLHTPGDIKDWGAHECFAKCQSIAREVLAKYRKGKR